MMRGTTLAVFALALLVTIGAPPAGGQESSGVEAAPIVGQPASGPLAGEALDHATEVVSSVLRCPTCQGLSVADSPSDSALAMKAEIRELLARGYSEHQVLSYFEASYGEFIRLEPKAQGFNLLVWLAPILGLLIGLALVARRLRAGAAAAPHAVAAERLAAADSRDPELAAYRQRVRDEVGG